MIRKQKYTIEEILPLIGVNQYSVLDGDRIKMRSLRLINFKVHGLVCVSCGISGVHFWKEKSHKRDGSYHLNLYGVRESDGSEVLMTQDHIKALSLGGEDVLENLQTMCQPCNSRKGDGRNKHVYKKVSLVEGIRTDYSPVRKNFQRIARNIEAGVATLEDVNVLLLAINKITSKHIQTVALKSAPVGISSIEEHDTHHKYFVPIGERVVIVHGDEPHKFYIFDRKSGERLGVTLR